MHIKSRLRGHIRLRQYILILLTSLMTLPAYAELKLTFGVYTTDQPTEMVKAYRPVLSGMESRLSEQLGDTVKIAIKVASTYERGVQDLIDGTVDFSMLGAASYISARKQHPNLKLLAIESKNHSKTFNGVIAVAQDSAIQSVNQLVGKTFAFGNKSSTIGRYLSQAYLFEHGIGVDELKGFEYLGRHDRVGHAVAKGKHDAGAL